MVVGWEVVPGPGQAWGLSLLTRNPSRFQGGLSLHVESHGRLSPADPLLWQRRETLRGFGALGSTQQQTCGKVSFPPSLHKLEKQAP